MMSFLFNSNSTISEPTAIKLPIIAVALLFAIIIVFSSSMGFKWFLLGFLGLSLACLATIFFDIRLFAILLLCACIPIDIQYDLLNHGKKFITIDHWGGAPDSPIVHLVDFPILFLIFLWLIDIGTGYKKLPKWTRFDTYSMSFLLFSCFSLFNTSEYALLFFEIGRYLKYFLLLWILRTYFDNSMYYWGCLYLIVLMVLLESMVACLQYFLYFSLPIPVGGVAGSQFELVNNVVIQRVTGLVGFSNTFAAYLLFPILTSFVIMISECPRFIRIIAAGLFVAGCIAIITTFSRNSWMVLTFGLILIIFIGIRKHRVSLGLILSLLGLAVAVFGFLLLSDVFQTILVRILEDEGGAYESRWDLFMVAVEIFKTFPLFGAGLNSFEEIMSLYDFSGVTNIIQQPVHNIYFLIAAETGTFALMIFIITGVHIIKRSLLILNNNDNLSFVVGCSSFAILVTLGISNFFDITMRKEPIIGMLILIVALILSHDKLKNESINTE